MALEGALENQLLGHDEGILGCVDEVRLVLRREEECCVVEMGSRRSDLNLEIFPNFPREKKCAIFLGSNR